MSTGRNDPCPCGSGKRYKHCHGAADSPEVLVRQGMAAHQRGDPATAERLYREALSRAADQPLALHYLGVALYQQKRLDEALPLLDRAAALLPQEPEFHNNRGLALAETQRHEDAIAAYRRTLEIKPDHAGAWSNLGRALQATGDIAGAIECFRCGLAAAPDLPQLHWNLALALLLRGDYENGWREYEWRLRAPELAQSVRSYASPVWDGGDPAGKTLLLTAEQGLGDAIQFLRFAANLAKVGARVIVAVPPALRTLAATAPGVAAALSFDDRIPAHDAHASLMSLPALLDISDVAGRVPYLRVDGDRKREALDARRSSLNVGVAWSGAPSNTDNATRSVSLAVLAPLFDVPGVQLFSLKRDVDTTADDRPLAEQMIELDMRNDFDGLAALVDSLDLVISVDTSIAHLAGALGKPLWVLLRRVPDWRWLVDRDDSPWYPTARLFRQRTAGDWSVPIAGLVEALRVR